MVKKLCGNQFAEYETWDMVIAGYKAESNSEICFTRSAMNSLCFLQCLFSQAAFRQRSALCSFLPWILSPLIRTVFPDQGQTPSITCKARLYIFLQRLFSNADVVVDAPSMCNNVSIAGDVCGRYDFKLALFVAA